MKKVHIIYVTPGVVATLWIFIRSPYVERIRRQKNLAYQFIYVTRMKRTLVKKGTHKNENRDALSSKELRVLRKLLCLSWNSSFEISTIHFHSSWIWNLTNWCTQWLFPVLVISVVKEAKYNTWAFGISGWRGWAAWALLRARYLDILLCPFMLKIRFLYPKENWHIQDPQLAWK